MNLNIFNIDHSKVRSWETPPALRKVNITSLFKCLTSPMAVLYLAFKNYLKAKVYELTITPQVCYLERLLNDRFDYTLRRIRIVDAVDHPPKYFYKRAEDKPVYFYKRSEAQPVFIYTRGETTYLSDDFIILVPATISFSDNEMLTLVKVFRLASMKPKIQRV